MPVPLLPSTAVPLTEDVSRVPTRGYREWFVFLASMFRGSPLGRRITYCTGTPNGQILGSVGDLAIRTDGGASTTLYVKESGAETDTGWAAK